MPAEMTLAEILEEAKRPEEAAAKADADHLHGVATVLRDRLKPFYAEHGPRLVAVAEAAVEMREAIGAYFGRHSIESDADGTSTKLAGAVAAWDALASPANGQKDKP